MELLETALAGQPRRGVRSATSTTWAIGCCSSPPTASAPSTGCAHGIPDKGRILTPQRVLVRRIEVPNHSCLRRRPRATPWLAGVRLSDEERTRSRGARPWWKRPTWCRSSASSAATFPAAGDEYRTSGKVCGEPLRPGSSSATGLIPSSRRQRRPPPGTMKTFRSLAWHKSSVPGSPRLKKLSLQVYQVGGRRRRRSGWSCCGRAAIGGGGRGRGGARCGAGAAAGRPPPRPSNC